MNRENICSSSVALGAQRVNFDSESGERLLELPALEAQDFQVFRRRELAQTLDTRTNRLDVL